MKCDELKDYDYDPDFPFQSRGRFYVADEVDAAIDELKHMLQLSEDNVSRLTEKLRSKIDEIKTLKAENERLKKKMDDYHLMSDIRRAKIKELKRALWLMTAEWAEAMGLASCNIANKFMSRENFEVGDNYRNNTVKKYRHRQVAFYKYADYCRKKAKEYK